MSPHLPPVPPVLQQLLQRPGAAAQAQVRRHVAHAVSVAAAGGKVRLWPQRQATQFMGYMNQM